MRIDSRRFAALAQGSNQRTNSIRVRSLFRNQGSAACKLIEKNSVNYHQRIIILTKVSEEERLISRGDFHHSRLYSVISLNLRFYNMTPNLSFILCTSIYVYISRTTIIYD